MRIPAWLPPFFGLVCLMLGLFACSSATTPVLVQNPPAAWPTSGWNTSTPEAQGMDSTRLAAMLDEIQIQKYPIHGLVIVRNGYLVLEAYASPFQAESRHYIASATKSFTSALVGIASEQGLIARLDEPLLEFFPARPIANLDAGKKAITLENLLTMSSGLEWPTDGLFERLGAAWRSSPDWAQFVLDQPVIHEPGTVFNYNSAGTYLLSAIIQKASGGSSLEYAKKNLFSPLGITNVVWAADPAGVNQGGDGLELTPRDMAKFGYLYLKNGSWDGKSIVPPSWVQASSAAQINTGYIYDYHYGYQWWVNPSGGYHARGFGGQRIFVLPEQQMVVTMTAGFSGEDMEYVPDTLLKTYILPAAQSAASLPANLDSRSRIQASLNDLAHPTPRAIAAFPTVATNISGKLFHIQPNSLNVQAFRWSFSGSQAQLEATINNLPLVLNIGLDDIYQATRIEIPGAPPVTYYLKGSWVSDETFILYAMQDGAAVQMKIIFREGGMELNIYVGGGVETVEGSL